MAYVGDRWLLWQEACNFFRLFLDLPNRHKGIKVCVENPVPHGYTLANVGPYTQTVQPWQFGHQEIKRTCFWLKNLPLLQPTAIVGPPPKDPELKKAWAVVHRTGPGKHRKADRSRTYIGIAEAVAAQWGTGEV